MKIGVTERGDAGINFQWLQKLSTVDGVILITKNLTEKFKEEVIKLYKKGFPIIVHCTCTGWGGSVIEPNVPEMLSQINSMIELIHQGFPAENIVFRIDPIFPTKNGLKRLQAVLTQLSFINEQRLSIPVKRVRISILDEYKHVKERFIQSGFEPVYGDKSYVSNKQLHDVAEILNQFNFKYETCAEDLLTKYLNNVDRIGCVSKKDLQIMGLPIVEMPENPQQRYGCHCLSCKTELLERKHPCPHNCLYCYWK